MTLFQSCADILIIIMDFILTMFVLLILEVFRFCCLKKLYEKANPLCFRKVKLVGRLMLFELVIRNNWLLIKSEAKSMV